MSAARAAVHVRPAETDLGGGATLVVEPAAMHVLEHYAWPGNVRELQNVLQRALVVAQEGAQPSLPQRKDVDALIAAGKTGA